VGVVYNVDPDTGNVILAIPKMEARRPSADAKTEMAIPDHHRTHTICVMFRGIDKIQRVPGYKRTEAMQPPTDFFDLAKKPTDSQILML